ncbi:30S ribosomal protein S6 [Coprobacillus sp. CAG:605]|jgi:small subunit ribosomal protein S6|nr:30S ribosomal protein S6 [Coprobacillus sp. CAG:605]
MNKYEIMFIVKATMEEAQVKEVANNMKKIVEDLKGKVVSFKEMGERKLAYAIKKEISGYYFVMTIEATKEVVKEFDRKASIDESILRHLVIKLDEE